MVGIREVRLNQMKTHGIRLSKLGYRITGSGTGLLIRMDYLKTKVGGLVSSANRPSQLF